MRECQWRRILLLLVCLAVGLALAARTCPQCGTSNPDNARFCKSCGYSFPSQSRAQSLPALRVSVTVEPGAVNISSTPDSAVVSVDGTRRGTTPLRLTGLSVGRHELQLTHPGYRSHSGTFTVPRPAGTIRVTVSPPGALVLVDGRSIGTAVDTGLVVTGLAFGSHEVVARLPGRTDEERTVVLGEAQPVTAVSIRFPAVDGFLSVESDPRGAGLAIDGRNVGRTAYFAALKPADYQLELSLGGFRSWRQQVAVRLGDTTRISAILVPVREPRWGLLAAGVAGIAGGVAGAVLGNASYREYVGAQPPEYSPAAIGDLRSKTIVYDWVRNIAGGLGALSLGAFFMF